MITLVIPGFPSPHPCPQAGLIALRQTLFVAARCLGFIRVLECVFDSVAAQYEGRHGPAILSKPSPKLSIIARRRFAVAPPRR
jgi:hypothetical protein